MAFIDELVGRGGLPYGMGIIEEPKGHDAIDSLMDDNLQEEIMNAVMGTVGGGRGKGLRQLMLALKGKIKGGKMTPSQPIRKGIVGGQMPPGLFYSKHLSSPVSGFKNIMVQQEKSNRNKLVDNILRKIEQRDPRYVNYGRGPAAKNESSIDNLLPFLLLSLTEGLNMGGESPNIGKQPKQY